MTSLEHTPAPRCDLSSLSQVELDRHHTAILGTALATCGGSKPWRCRKEAETRELLALAQLSNRLVILQLDLSVDMRVALLMRVPVPCFPDPAGPLKVADSAHLGIIYREEVMLMPQPGFSFVQILAPCPVWHANVTRDATPVQTLCLGPSLPAGIPLREIILITYGALTLQTTQFDPGNSAGVLNPEAAEWYQHNPHLVPLSREPFLDSQQASQ